MQQGLAIQTSQPGLGQRFGQRGKAKADLGILGGQRLHWGWQVQRLFDFASQADFKGRGIKTGDRADAAAARRQRRPKGFAAGADRRDHAKSGDGNPSHKPPSPFAASSTEKRWPSVPDKEPEAWPANACSASRIAGAAAKHRPIEPAKGSSIPAEPGGARRRSRRVAWM